MSCNTKTSLAAVIDAVNAQLNNNYVDRDDPRIDQGVFTEPTIRGGLMLDEAAKLDFCGYVTECGQLEPLGKQWVDRPLYPHNTLVSYEDGGEIKSRWQDIDDIVAGTEIVEALGKRTIYVESMTELVNLDSVTDGQVVHVTGYHDGRTVGGGRFVYRQSVPKSDHNGVKVISPSVPSPETQVATSLSRRADFFNRGTGETDPTGSGCFVRIPFSGERIYSARNAGCVQGEACTENLQWLIDIAPVGESVWLDRGDSFLIRGLDLRTPTRVSIASDAKNIEYALPVLTTVGPPIYTNPHGKSVAILVNDDPMTLKRGRHLDGFLLVEGGAVGNRDYGVYAVGVPWFRIGTMQTIGFGIAMTLSETWDTKIDDINLTQYRIGGLALRDVDDTILNSQEGTSVNGLHIGSMRTGSTVDITNRPQFNLDAAGNAIVIENWVTEGYKQTHIRATKTLKSLTINQIHAEGDSSFITVDLTSGTPTLPFGKISIAGGQIQQMGGVGSRFVAAQGSFAGSGLAELYLGPVSLIKRVTTEADYTDLSYVGVFSSHAHWESYPADAAINGYTWKRVGRAITSSRRKKAQFGHDGLPLADFHGVYSGMTEELITRVRLTGPELAANAPMGAIIGDARTSAQDTYIVNIRVDRGSAFTAEADHATILVTQNRDNNTIQEVMAATGTIAQNTSIQINAGKLTAYNTLGEGTYVFRIHRIPLLY